MRSMIYDVIYGAHRIKDICIYITECAFAFGHSYFIPKFCTNLNPKCLLYAQSSPLSPTLQQAASVIKGKRTDSLRTLNE